MADQSLSEILPELDQKSQELLASLADLEPNTETVTTPDLIETTGISRPQIHYRLNEYLQPYGLVETHQPTGENPGKVPPKELWLTDRGHDLVDELGSPARDTDIGGRLSRLEEQMDAVQSTVQSLDAQPSDTSADPEVDGDLDALQEQIGALAMEVEDLKEDAIFEKSIRSDIDDTRAGVLAVISFLIEKHGEEQKLQRLTDQYLEDLDQLAES